MNIHPQRRPCIYIYMYICHVYILACSKWNKIHWWWKKSKNANTVYAHMSWWWSGFHAHMDNKKKPPTNFIRNEWFLRQGYLQTGVRKKSTTHKPLCFGNFPEGHFNSIFWTNFLEGYHANKTAWTSPPGKEPAKILPRTLGTFEIHIPLWKTPYQKGRISFYEKDKFFTIVKTGKK